MRTQSRLLSSLTVNDTFTENAMPTHSKSGSSLVDLFFKMGASRKASSDELIRLFVSAFGEDSLRAVKAMFYNRDIRGGQGERRSFRIFFKYLCENHPEVAIKNLHNVVEFGRWDDLLEGLETPVQDSVLDFIRNGLYSGDKLCAKWMPREGKSTDLLAKKLIKALNTTPRNYRKILAGNTEVIETLMCSGQWGEINYNHTPSVAAKKYRKAFYRHDKERYEKWVDDLSNPDSGAKINASAIFPHDIVGPLLNQNYGAKVGLTESKQLEAQWAALPDYMPKGKKILPVCDVSGSMSGLPLQVCIALGLYLSERNEGLFHNAFITFSSIPTLQYLQGVTLSDRVKELESAEWEMNTDIEAVFGLILKQALKAGLSSDDMPESILILSDMQFDRCVRKYDDNVMEMINRMYTEAGYSRPSIVFWNLRAGTGSPVKYDERGTALVSGFSPSVMKMTLGKNMNPLSVAMETLDSERYESVVI